MQPDPLALHQDPVDHLAEQGVAERIARGPAIRAVRLDQDPLLDRQPERVGDVTMGQPKDPGQQVVVDAPATGRRSPQDLLDLGRQDRDARQEDVTQLGREPALPAPTGGREQLVGEERVAATPIEQGLDELRAGPFAEPGSRQGDHVVTAEGPDVEAFDARIAFELGEEPEDRGPARELVGADGDHPEGGRRPQVPDQEREQVPRGLVGPLEVLDHPHDRASAGHPLHDPEDELEQASLAATIELERVGQVRRPIAELRQQPGELTPVGTQDTRQPTGLRRADEGPESLDEWRVRHAMTAHLEARAREHVRAALGRRAGEPFEQPGLADPGLAGDDDRPAIAVARLREGVAEARELRPTPDEPLGLGPGHGRRMIRARIGAVDLRSFATPRFNGSAISRRTTRPSDRGPWTAPGTAGCA